MDRARFCFGDIVVVGVGYIGCVVKSCSNERFFVYVRSFAYVIEYTESQLQRYVVGKET